MKAVTRWLILLAVVMAGVSLAFWWKGSNATAEKSEVPDSVVTAERRDIESTLLLTGEVTPAFEVEVKPEVGGKIKEISVHVGETVKKGAPLVTIDDRDLQTERSAALTQIEGAQLSVNKTKGNYERAKALHEVKLISQEAFSNLEADYAIAENALEQAKRRLQTVDDRIAKTMIIAPADGTVLDIPVNEGQVVTAAASVNSGTLIMNFADLSKLLIYSHVNQVDAPRLKPGQEVDINLADGTAQTLRARIEFIAPLAKVKNNVKGFEVQAEILDNDGRLKPGMSVSMNVPVGRAENAVTVPVTAVFRERRESIVYVQKGDVTERRKVKVGLTDLSFAEIRSGVEAGEKILLIEPAGQVQTPSKS